MAAGVNTNSVRLLAVGLSVLLGVVFWVSRQGGQANERPEARGTVAGFTTYAVPSADFSIAVPESWKTFTAEEVFAPDEALDEFVRENPSFAALRDTLSDPSSPVKLIAADPNVQRNFATNLNVVVNPAPSDFSLEDFATQTEAELKQFGFVSGDLRSETVHLPAGEAQRLSYSGEFNLNGQPSSLALIQYGLIEDGRTYVLTFTTLPELAEDYRDDFERSALSFALD
jgi:hypothetical protein